MNIKSLIGKHIAVHCTTVEEANLFLEMCDMTGIKWCYGDELLCTNNWNRYKTHTCYYISKDGLHYNSVEWYREFYYKIITFNKFLMKLQGKRTYYGSFELKADEQSNIQTNKNNGV